MKRAAVDAQTTPSILLAQRRPLEDNDNSLNGSNENNGIHSSYSSDTYDNISEGIAGGNKRNSNNVQYGDKTLIMDKKNRGNNSFLKLNFIDT